MEDIFKPESLSIKKGETSENVFSDRKAQAQFKKLENRKFFNQFIEEFSKGRPDMTIKYLVNNAVKVTMPNDFCQSSLYFSKYIYPSNFVHKKTIQKN